MAKLEERLFSMMGTNGELEEENARLCSDVADLKRQLAAARKDSPTSSKPPSSDIVKPAKPLAKGGKNREKGGQPGHEQHVRSPFPPEVVDPFEVYTLDCCPDCGGKLLRSRREPEVVQQVELHQTPTLVTEHRGWAYRCPHCRTVHYDPMPKAAVKAGLLSSRPTRRVGARWPAWPSCGRHDERLPRLDEKSHHPRAGRLTRLEPGRTVLGERGSVPPLGHDAGHRGRRTIWRHPVGSRRFAWWSWTGAGGPTLRAGRGRSTRGGNCL